MDNRPIGVFDSGLGGLTAVRELMRIMPREDIVYFGDTGRAPYGTKGRETIVRFTAQDIRFLLTHQVKAIIIACGTVSSSALEEARMIAPCPVMGVIEPAARAATAVTAGGRIGILGTSATVRSGSFEKAVHVLLPGAQVVSRACPMFVPLVENGYFGRGCQVTELLAHEYLDDLRGKVDTLILGCTHYPILSDIIGDIMGDGVRLVDTGRETALNAKKLLESAGLDNPEGSGTRQFFVSDRTDDFARMAGILLNDSIGPDGVGPVGLVEIDRYEQGLTEISRRRAAERNRI